MPIVEKRIAIYGGSFDPICNHHIAIAKKLLIIFDEVWIMPCYVSVSDKKLAHATHRLNMCDIAITNAGESNIKLCRFEIDNHMTGEPCYIIDELKKKYHSAGKSYFVIGSDTNFVGLPTKQNGGGDTNFVGLSPTKQSGGGDNAMNITTWRNYSKLIKMIPFVVVPRYGFIVPENSWCNEPPHVNLTSVTQFIPGSSTDFRTQYTTNGTADPDSINLNVFTYIKNHDIYKDVTK